MLYKEPSLHIFFGDTTTSIEREQFYHIDNAAILSSLHPFATICSSMNIGQVTFLRQTHSADGYIIRTGENLPPYTHEGDYLITNQLNFGIGIATADCLPIIFFDPTTKLVGIAHAGWQGSIKHIAQITVENLCKQGAHIGTMRVFFGPSAKSCCYQVGTDFTPTISTVPSATDTVLKRGNELFFDLPLFNQQQLALIGIPPTAINSSFNRCTMCDPAYCSYRRQGAVAKRQLTIVALR